MSGRIWYGVWSLFLMSFNDSLLGSFLVYTFVIQKSMKCNATKTDWQSNGFSALIYSFNISDVFIIF